MAWPRKQDKRITINGQEKCIPYVSVFTPRCRVCGNDANGIGLGYIACENPSCSVSGFKVDSEGKMLKVWLGKPLDYTKKPAVEEQQSPPSMDDILEDFDEKEYRSDKLALWKTLEEVYKSKSSKCPAEKRAERLIASWYLEEQELGSNE